nr:hypothetical protein [Prevotella intermedia]
MDFARRQLGVLSPIEQSIKEIEAVDTIEDWDINIYGYLQVVRSFYH